MVAIMYATGQVKTHVRRRWFFIGVTLLIILISILVFPPWAGSAQRTVNNDGGITTIESGL
jgi:hypothetical protein